MPNVHSAFLGQNSRISIVLQLLGASITADRAITEPARVMAICCNSRQRPIEHLDKMADAFLEAIDTLRAQGIIECPEEFILRDPTPDQALSAIERIDPHILVTICYGERHRTALQWEDGLSSMTETG